MDLPNINVFVEPGWSLRNPRAHRHKTPDAVTLHPGYAEAQHNMGIFYDRGEHIVRDYAASAQWLRKAADQGQAKAMFKLGSHYLTGLRALERNDEEAAKWHHRAAMLGNDHSANFLGHSSLNRHDLIKAYAWFSQRHG